MLKARSTGFVIDTPVMAYRTPHHKHITTRPVVVGLRDDQRGVGRPIEQLVNANARIVGAVLNRRGL